MQSGISCVQLVGSMSLAARDAAIKRFAEDSDCKIFLMSLKAGGVALNLTVASHVSDSPLLSCYLFPLMQCYLLNKNTRHVKGVILGFHSCLS